MNNFSDDLVDMNGRSVLVTGGTGSFGKKFVEILLKRYKLRRLIIFSRDELKQYEMAEIFNDSEHPCLRYFIGDVRDVSRLQMAMSGVDYVVHAAAMKQVPTAEYNPFECIHTNVLGAENVVRAAIAAGVKRVIGLSTDKAANPGNLYGASKLSSDKILIAANHLAGASGPRFSVVRYGNVIGSRGSVVPFFKRLVSQGAESIPITHAEMTRFWITLEQGVNFVLSSFAQMEGGEIFVPKIPSMSVVDLAKVVAPNLPIRMIGVRPGEKLHEVMITEDDARHTRELPDRYVIMPAFAGWRDASAKTEPGKPVADRFSYVSNTNSDWLDQDGLRKLLKVAGIEV